MAPSGLRRLASILPFATMTMLGNAAAEEAMSLRAQQEIVVDANDADWKGVPAFALPHTRSLPSPYGREPALSDPDCSATFMSQWSDDHLYFLVVVRDDLTKSEPNRPLFLNDGIEVYLDGGNDRATTYDSNDFHLFIDVRDQLATGESSSPADGAAVLHEVREVPGGYVFELAVPWSMLGPVPRAGVRIGFDLAVNDNDKGQDLRDSQLMWNGNGMEYTDPTQFGTLALYDAADVEPRSVYGCGSAGASPLAALVALALLGLRMRTGA